MHQCQKLLAGHRLEFLDGVAIEGRVRRIGIDELAILKNGNALQRFVGQGVEIALAPAAAGLGGSGRQFPTGVQAQHALDVRPPEKRLVVLAEDHRLAQLGHLVQQGLDLVRAPLRDLTLAVRAGLELRTLAAAGTIRLFV